MLRTRVKICGLTSVEEALQAVALGADAIGLVFYSKSSRAVSLELAREIRAALPAFVCAVGLFVNPSKEEVQATLAQVPLDCLQFHGDEAPSFCGAFERPYMKAIRVVPGLDLDRKIQEYSDSCAILLDSFSATSAGGTGEVFDWSIAQDCVSRTSRPIVLAGGLSSSNVADAIRIVQPYAVDVSSGVESEPGRKSEQRMKAFFNEVYSV